MRFEPESLPTHIGPVQRIETRGDLKRIRYHDGMAALDIAWEAARHIRFRNEDRPRTPRLSSLVNAIRTDGFVPYEPIVCRVSRKGKWHVLDGGHRLTAARHVAGEFWANLFAPKVRRLYVIVFRTPKLEKARRVAAKLREG